MPYSLVGVMNLALLEIGANIISDFTDNTPNAIKANAVYLYLLDEVLQARDWRFAKLRADLQQSTTTPDYGYNFAYAMPTDFLRLVKPKPPPSRGHHPLSDYNWPDSSGYHRGRDYDPPVWPPGFPYIIETLPADGSLYLLSNYNNVSNPLHINYIRRITDATKFSPTFIKALTKRWAAALAVPITEDKQQASQKEAEYDKALNSAEAINESFDYQEDEAGGTEWIDAGRGSY